MTALEELWYGNIDPHEAILQDDKQFKNLLSLMGRNRDKLSDTLTEQQKETLESTTPLSTKCTPSPNYPPSDTASPWAFGL